ncbi:MAG: MurT ligase domain-containing protein [Acidimicrobiales bacterium]
MTVTHLDRGLTPRATTAVQVATAVNRLSRLLGRGSGTVIGGKAGLAVDPSLLSALSGDRPVALVSGTNGKTTTTAMLAAALTGDAARPAVATNRTGANMPAGHVAALIDARHAEAAVLEVDEGYLGRLIEDTRPRVVVLLNLSRDQLDRIAEVRMLADRWRLALGGIEPGAGTVVVANADDPLVVWAAMTAPDVRWVGAGQVWHEDAVGCPSCGGRIVFDPSTEWHCDTCRFARPVRFARLEGEDLVLADGGRHRLAIALPGQFNRANAAMVVVAAAAMPALPGRVAVTLPEALERVGRLAEVAGRFSTVHRHGRAVRLLLAKNPAGWTAILDLLDESGPSTSPVVLSVNARVADGFDPSWLWDVPFERLAGRRVVATGERCRDLAVRLRYAEVHHTTVADPVEAVDAAIAAADGPAPVEFLGNYTAFATARSRL